MIILDENGKLSSKSIVHKGNVKRITCAMMKAAEGKMITVGYIGGSITEGAGASSWGKNYASVTTHWWKNKFPEVDIRCINAGIGATGSILGLHRVYDDLLRHKPDFVIVEYAVNDEDSDITAKCYESLVRRILKSENRPGVMLMFTTRNDGSNVQELQKKTGLHYDLPMASFRDAVWPEISEGRIKWEDVEADVVHPNDNGHYLMSKFITDRLEEIYKNLSTYADRDFGEIKEAIYSQEYMNASILNNTLIEPVTYGSWCTAVQTPQFRAGWAANGGFDPLIFEVEGKNIGIIYKKYNTCDMGRVEVRIDDQTLKLLDGHFEADWGGYAHGEILAENLSKGKHKVEIKLCKDSHPDSKGREFVICGFMVS